MERALWAQGIRKPLEKGKRRHEFQADHGFRKYFKTIAERHMKSLHVEILMGHSIGLGDNYYRITEKELLAEYSKAVPDLSVPNSPIVMDEERMKRIENDVTAIKYAMARLICRFQTYGKLTPEDIQENLSSLTRHFRLDEDGVRVKNEENCPGRLFYEY